MPMLLAQPGKGTVARHGPGGIAHDWQLRQREQLLARTADQMLLVQRRELQEVKRILPGLVRRLPALFEGGIENESECREQGERGEQQQTGAQTKERHTGLPFTELIVELFAHQARPCSGCEQTVHRTLKTQDTDTPYELSIHPNIGNIGACQRWPLLLTLAMIRSSVRLRFRPH